MFKKAYLESTSSISSFSAKKKNKILEPLDYSKVILSEDSNQVLSSIACITYISSLKLFLGGWTT